MINLHFGKFITKSHLVDVKFLQNCSIISELCLRFIHPLLTREYDLDLRLNLGLMLSTKMGWLFFSFDAFIRFHDKAKQALSTIIVATGMEWQILPYPVSLPLDIFLNP